MAEVKDNTVYHDDPVYISYAGKSDSVYSTANHTVEAIDKERTRDSSVTALIKHFDSRKIPYIKDTIDIKGGRIPDFERKIGQAKRVVIFLSDKYFISPHTMYEWDLIHQNKEVKTIRYVYYTDEKIIAKDADKTVLFHSGRILIKDCFNDYLEKCLTPSWKQWYDALKKDVATSNRMMSEVEAYACNGVTSQNKKVNDYDDANLFKNTFLEIPSILKDASIVRDSYDKLLGSNAAFDIATWFSEEFDIQDDDQSYEHSIMKLPDDNDARFVHRDSLADSLFEKIYNNQFVNLFGIGGNGKTTLLQLMYRRYAHRFDYVAYSDINGNIKDEIFDNLKNEFGMDENDFIALDSDAKYRRLIGKMSLLKTKHGRLNLFVIDINNYDKNKKATDDFIKDIEDKLHKNKSLYPDGWKVLFITRKKIDIKVAYKIEFQKLNEDKEKDIMFLAELFKRNSEGRKDLGRLLDENGNPTERLKKLFMQLFLSPLLTTLLAKAEGDIDSVIKNLHAFDNEELKSVGIDNRGDDEDTIGKYLDNLVKFDNLPKGQQHLASLFMLWPAEYIDDEDIKALSGSYYKKEVLDDLCKRGILTNAGGEYSMHGLLSEVLRRQFLEKYDSRDNWGQKVFYPMLDRVRKMFRIYPNYDAYIANCSELIYNTKYLNCIVCSLKYDIGKESKISVLRNHENVKSYLRAEELEAAIIDPNKSTSLAANHFELAELSFYSLKRYSAAKIHYLEAINQGIAGEDRVKSYYQAGYISEKDDNDVEALQYYKECIKLDTDSVFKALAYCRLVVIDDESSDENYYNAVKIFDKVDVPTAESEQVEYVNAYYNVAKLEDVKSGTVYQRSPKTVLEQYSKVNDILSYMSIDTSYYYKELKANVLVRLADNDLISSNDYKAAKDKYKTAAELFDEVSEYYADKGFSMDGFGMRNMADANYRYGFIMDYWYYLAERKPIVMEHYSKAKNIWQSLPAETEGDLKGFVITSYGILDKEFGFELVKVEKGGFEMGISEEEKTKCKGRYSWGSDEKLHHVEIKDDFYIGMYPVTKGQWEYCRQKALEIGVKLPEFETMQKDGYQNLIIANNIPDDYDLQIGGQKDIAGNGIIQENKDNYPNKPMYYVNADDADNFVNVSNSVGKRYRLPSEAEWEYAARGGAKMKERCLFSGSDLIECVAHFGSGIYPEREKYAYGKGPENGGEKKPNILGIYDMSGNVWEWCQDWYSATWYDEKDGAVGGVCPKDKADDIPFKYSEYCLDGFNGKYEHGPARVLRGGSWDYDAQNCRVSNRSWFNPYYRISVLGFRLALSFAKH